MSVTCICAVDRARACANFHAYVSMCAWCIKKYLYHCLQTDLQRHFVPAGIRLKDRLFTIQLVLFEISVYVLLDALFQGDAIHCWLLMIRAIIHSWLRFGADKISQPSRFFSEHFPPLLGLALRVLLGYRILVS